MSGDSSQEERGGERVGRGERGRENHACERECVQECARGREGGRGRELKGGGVKLYRVCRVSNPVQDGSNASNPLPEVT